MIYRLDTLHVIQPKLLLLNTSGITGDHLFWIFQDSSLFHGRVLDLTLSWICLGFDIF